MDNNTGNEVITIEESDKQTVSPAIGMIGSVETIPRLLPDDESKLANIEVPNMAVSSTTMNIEVPANITAATNSMAKQSQQN